MSFLRSDLVENSNLAILIVSRGLLTLWSLYSLYLDKYIVYVAAKKILLNHKLMNKSISVIVHSKSSVYKLLWLAVL